MSAVATFISNASCCGWRRRDGPPAGEDGPPAGEVAKKTTAKPKVKEVLAVVSLEVTHFVDLLAFFLQPMLSVAWPCICSK
jgi:hypothetical protein